MRKIALLLALFDFSLLPSASTADEAKAEKRFAVALQGKTWPEVFKWLRDVTGKLVIAEYKPTGTCNVPTRPGSRHTLNEVIDLLNQELLGNNPREPLFLLPREHSIALLSVEAVKHDRWQPIRIPIEELPLYPRTTPLTVSVVLRLKTLKATDLIPQVKKMMGTTGDVFALERVNALVLEDRPHTLARIVAHLRKLDIKKKP